MTVFLSVVLFLVAVLDTIVVLKVFLVQIPVAAVVDVAAKKAASEAVSAVVFPIAAEVMQMDDTANNLYYQVRHFHEFHSFLGSYLHLLRKLGPPASHFLSLKRIQDYLMGQSFDRVQVVSSVSRSQNSTCFESSLRKAFVVRLMLASPPLV